MIIDLLDSRENLESVSGYLSKDQEKWLQEYAVKVFKPLMLYCTVNCSVHCRKHVTFCRHSVFDGEGLEMGEKITLERVECSENKACPAAVLKEVFGDKK